MKLHAEHWAARTVILTGLVWSGLSAAEIRAQQDTAAIAEDFESQVEKWGSAVRRSLSDENGKSIAEEALLAAERAELAEQFGPARRLAKVATRAAHASKDPMLLKWANSRDRELTTAEHNWLTYRQAAKLLNDNVDVPKNSLVVGRFLCFTKDNWELGLPNLEHGNNETLRELAKTSLAVAKSADARIELGNAWWKAAEKSPAAAKTELFAGALHFYSLALPDVRGTERIGLELRIGDAVHRLELGRILSPLIEITFKDKTKLRLRLIPSGTFVMGSPPTEPNRRSGENQQQIDIPRPLYVGITEVTQDQWYAVLKGRNSCAFVDPERPVESVPINRVQEFIDALNSIPQRRKLHFRLPTNAEWEYACRAGSSTAYHFGDDPSILDSYAWHSGNTKKQTELVGRLKPNAWGLFDMLGNVQEFAIDTAATQGSPTSRTLPPAESVIARGGSWRATSEYCRSANRNAVGLLIRDPRVSLDDLGFRVICDILH